MSRHAQKSAPSARPRSARWNAWLCALTKPGIWNLSATCERIRRCCGASWSWGWHRRVSPCLRAARAPERWRSSTTPGTGRPRTTARGSTGTRTTTGRRATSTRASTRHAGRTRATTRPSSTSRWRRSRPPASTRSSSPGGAGLAWRTRGCRSCSPRRAGTGSSRRSTSSRTRAARPRRCVQDLKYLAALGVRDVFVYHPRDIAGGRLGGAAAAARRPSCGSSRDRARRLRRGRALRRLLHVRLHQLRRRASSSRLCSQAHAVHLLCAPSVGPGYDGVRAGEAAVLSRRARDGATYDNLWTAALAAQAGHRDDHELQRVGRGDADRGRRRRTAATATTTAPGGSPASRRRRRYLTRTAYWTGALPFRPRSRP